MLIAGEASGDMLAAELVPALSSAVLKSESGPTADVQPLHTELVPHFFGAGGPRMAAAGVELAFDLTQHSVIGISDVLKNYPKFRRLFRQLFQLAIERQPDVIIGVDYGGFNLRFAKAIKQHVRKHRSEFVPWNPRIVQFVSPQVWASRPGRAYQMADTHDLVLSIFPFEKSWYASRVPRLRVEFVGHPMVERFSNAEIRNPKSETTIPAPTLLLLPGSRKSELDRHLPVMFDALKLIRTRLPSLTPILALPDERLARQAGALGTPDGVRVEIGNLPRWLNGARVAIASTGTVTTECAYFGVPTVTLYKTSRLTYEIGKRIVTVKWLTMPNILADEEIYPEFIQNAATAENISNAALTLLTDESRHNDVCKKLSAIKRSLGAPGAAARSAQLIVDLLHAPSQ